jgi:hypothetical protein
MIIGGFGRTGTSVKSKKDEKSKDNDEIAAISP